MGFSINYSVVIKMKLIVLIALVGCALAIPYQPYGPSNGLRIPDYHPYEKQQYGPANGLRIPGQYYNKGYYNKQQYGPTNGLRIPGQYYCGKGYSRYNRCLPTRRYRRRRTCYPRRRYAKG